MTPDEQVQAAVHLLDQFALALGVTREELDRRAGWFRGATSRLLTGQAKLTYKHILLMLEALGIEPQEFFLILHSRGRTRRGVDLEQLRGLVTEAGGTWVLASSPAAPEDEERERLELASRVDAAIRQVLQRRGMPVPPGRLG